MPAGLSSTLIHFAPLLTTTSPCGQYFFFVLFTAAADRGLSRSCRWTEETIWKPGKHEQNPIESLALFGFPFYVSAARLTRYVPRSSRDSLHPGRPTLCPRPA